MINLSIFSGQSCCQLLTLFLWMLGSFLLGWFLHKYFNKPEECEDCDCSQCEEELKAAKTALANASKPSSNIASTVAASSFAAAAVADDSVKDDLKKIEGIGPKIQEHLNNDGIWSFAQLAASSVERIQGVLDAAGPRYRMHNPGTWPEQAALARDGKWDELKKWQDELDGGR